VMHVAVGEQVLLLCCCRHVRAEVDVVLAESDAMSEEIASAKKRQSSSAEDRFSKLIKERERCGI